MGLPLCRVINEHYSCGWGLVIQKKTLGVLYVVFDLHAIQLLPETQESSLDPVHIPPRRSLQWGLRGRHLG